MGTTEQAATGRDEVRPAAPVRRVPATGRCACGHERAVHEHYRRGTDCGVCGCAEFRRRRLRRRLRG